MVLLSFEKHKSYVQKFSHSLENHQDIMNALYSTEPDSSLGKNRVNSGNVLGMPLSGLNRDFTIVGICRNGNYAQNWFAEYDNI
jgi:hypothetical protein